MSVILTDGQRTVSLVPSGPPRLGFPTRIEVAAAPFRADLEAEARDYEEFRDQLIRVHRTLLGEARLMFWEQEHAIILTGDGGGRVVIKVEITDGKHPKQVWLTIIMNIDQSYLPEIIQSIETAFLKASPV
jgi:hypothetical protein